MLANLCSKDKKLYAPGEKIYERQTLCIVINNGQVRDPAPSSGCRRWPPLAAAGRRCIEPTGTRAPYPRTLPAPPPSAAHARLKVAPRPLASRLALKRPVP